MRITNSDIYFILDENKRVTGEADLMKWSDWIMHDENRIIKQTKIGGTLISTCFLGLSIGDDRLFETMVFNGPEEDLQFRDETYAEALSRHDMLVNDLTRQTQNIESQLGNEQMSEVRPE